MVGAEGRTFVDGDVYDFLATDVAFVPEHLIPILE